MKRINFLIVTLLLAACTVEQPISTIQPANSADDICVAVSAPDFVPCNDTKSSISTTGAFAWTGGDRIGIFSNKIGADTQTPSQLALTLRAGEGTSAAYSTTTGWALVPGSDFNFFSYYPYSETNAREQIIIDYTGQVQTANNSTAGLGEYDYLYSDMAMAASSSAASFSFHHIGCLTNVNITVPSGYENTTFYSMKLLAESELFTSSATYSVNDIVASGAPSLDAQTCYGIKLSFGDAGIKPTDGVISAWIMMAPAQWKDRTITAKLYAARNNVPTVSGTFTPDADQTAGVKYSYSLTSSATGQILPARPDAGEQLHILLFGHSFGIDCTQYLPAITKSAGITDVHYGRWYQANCRLSEHWGHVTAKDTYQYYDSDPAKGIWNEHTLSRVDDVLSQYPWDIIVFQQCTGFTGEGKYSSYQPHLNYLTDYVTTYCENVHGKTPVIGWNMFWGFNESRTNDYDRGERGALAMYYANVQAAQDMIADNTKSTEINLVIPSGTAIQNARGTSLNDPGSEQAPSTTGLLTRDGLHASLGIGRYVTACTWFQYLIAPIYGIDITGNTYRPTGKSFDKDLVTDARAVLCWKCAKAAVEHPFEVTHIEE